MIKKMISFSVASLLVAGALAGCSSGSPSKEGGDKAASTSPSAAPTLSNEPVTIKYLCSTTPATCVDLMNKAKAIAKLPNVTIEADIATNLDKDIASGWVPDIVNVTAIFFYKMIDAGLVQDMTPLLKRNNFDLSLYPPEQIAAIRKYDPAGGVFAVPDKLNFPYNSYGLVYNKDIFDKFALPYPKDNMTWEEVVALGQKLTREDSGVKYTGLVIDQPKELLMQEALNFSDNKGNLTMNDPKWKTVLELLKSAHDATNLPVTTGLDIFYKQKTIAMYAGNMQLMLQSIDSFDKDMNWDIATFPRFSDMKETLIPPVNGLFAVTKQSKNQDIALKLLQAMQSPEMQQTARDLYENPTIKKKHVAALTNKKTATFLPEKFYNTSEAVFRKKLGEMYNKNVDVNTTLMQLQQEVKVSIDQQLNK